MGIQGGADSRNPLIFQFLTLLDAGSVISNLIQDRHDCRINHLNLYCDTAFSREWPISEGLYKCQAKNEIKLFTKLVPITILTAN